MNLVPTHLAAPSAAWGSLSELSPRPVDEETAIHLAFLRLTHTSHNPYHYYC